MTPPLRVFFASTLTRSDRNLKLSGKNISGPEPPVDVVVPFVFVFRIGLGKIISEMIQSMNALDTYPPRIGTMMHGTRPTRDRRDPDF